MKGHRAAIAVITGCCALALGERVFLLHNNCVALAQKKIRDRAVAGISQGE